MRLEIELVPSTAWYSNMRKAVSRADWDNIRKQTYADYGHRCGICFGEGRMNCHELWGYDDKDHIQLLVGFIALCDMCHHVKHIGLAGILSRKGQLDYQKVVDHYIKVNDCTKEDFEDHRAQAFAQYRERSEHEWKTEFGNYKHLVKSDHH